jgi:hypothetical protein
LNQFNDKEPVALLQAGVLHPPFIFPLVKNTNEKQKLQSPFNSPFTKGGFSGIALWCSPLAEIKVALEYV